MQSVSRGLELHNRNSNKKGNKKEESLAGDLAQRVWMEQAMTEASLLFLLRAQMERGKIPSDCHSFNVIAALPTGIIPSYGHVFISDFFWWGELP